MDAFDVDGPDDELTEQDIANSLLSFSSAGGGGPPAGTLRDLARREEEEENRQAAIPIREPVGGNISSGPSEVADVRRESRPPSVSPNSRRVVQKDGRRRGALGVVTEKNPKTVKQAKYVTDEGMDRLSDTLSRPKLSK